MDYNTVQDILKNKKNILIDNDIKIKNHDDLIILKTLIPKYKEYVSHIEDNFLKICR